MKVELLNGHRIMEDFSLAGRVASICYKSNGNPMNIIKHCLKSGHYAPTRDVLFKFMITDMTRGCSLQMLRQTIGVTPLQESQRYVKYDSEDLSSLYDSNNLPSYATDCMDNTIKVYRRLLEDGFKAEDARGVLPNNFHTTMYYSVSLEALMNLCEKRLCVRSQKEIRTIVGEMKKLALESITDEGLKEILKDLFKPICDKTGICKEMSACPKGKILQSRGGN